MKAIKVLVIALVAAFTINTVSAQTTTPAKAGAEKSQTKKGHKKHHKKHSKKVAKA
jgi:hypothetical protein